MSSLLSFKKESKQIFVNFYQFWLECWFKKTHWVRFSVRQSTYKLSVSLKNVQYIHDTSRNWNDLIFRTNL